MRLTALFFDQRVLPQPLSGRAFFIFSRGEKKSKKKAATTMVAEEPTKVVGVARVVGSPRADDGEQEGVAEGEVAAAAPTTTHIERCADNEMSALSRCGAKLMDGAYAQQPVEEEEEDGPLEPPSLVIAYTLWLVSAVCCACNVHIHLVYLGRYRHCVLNTLSCGCCGISRLFELCAMPRYAAESIGEARKVRAWPTGRVWSTLRPPAAFAFAYAFGEIGRHTSNLFVERKPSSPEYFRTDGGPIAWPLRVHGAGLLGALGTACGAVAVFTVGATRTSARRVVGATLATTVVAIVLQHLDAAR